MDKSVSAKLSPSSSAKYNENHTTEIYEGEQVVGHDGELKRALKSRHIGMIA